ncbi:MAG: U32 family peptidase, partial [Spirochaetaceae bacterium]|nr:U32 family peptidase [Spirochaetaceae bacterium]
MEQNKKFELLAPAGSPEALNAAVGEGADAVYLGLKNFNARLRGTNFAYSQFEAALNALHKIKRKLYLTLNTVWTEREADRMYQLLGYLSKTSVDGIIVQDFGTLNFLRRYFKQLTVHASTQMNCASSRACNILSTHGVSRVVLARELTLEEIREIRNHTNIELEVFVHGALCVSASGLCLFSSYLGGKSANRGMCTQACRRKYSSVNDESKYYFSPLDLQLIEKLPELALAGVRSFKIEGRMKSADYTGITVAAYRLVLDAIEEERPVFEALKKAQTMLKSDFARQKSCFFIDEKSNVSFLNAGEDGGSGIKIGVISRISGKKALIKNAAQIPETGDTLRIHKSDDSMRSAYKINFIENKDDGSFWCNIPESGFTEGDVIYLMQSKKNSKRYAPVLPKLPDSYKKQPGHESAPEVQFKFYGKPEFAEGFFVSAANIEDLYVIQSIRPSMVILSLDCANAKKLCNNKNILPFKPKEIMLNFVPFYNEDADSEFTNYIPRLFEMGYKTYFINNIAQFSIFKNIKAHLIAGE